MKVAILCTIFSVLAIALSQPTYDLEQQELCDGVCQQQDLETLQKQFSAQFTAINNKISQLLQLEEQVNRFFQRSIMDSVDSQLTKQTQISQPVIRHHQVGIRFYHG